MELHEISAELIEKHGMPPCPRLDQPGYPLCGSGGRVLWWLDVPRLADPLGTGCPIETGDAEKILVHHALKWFIEKNGEPRFEQKFDDDGNCVTTVHPSLWVPTMVLIGGLEKLLIYLNGEMEMVSSD